MKPLIRISLILWFLTQVSLMGFAQSGIITTYVGPGLPVFGVKASTQAIDQPYGVAPDGTGGFYVTSWTQNRVYRVASDGRLGLVAGSGTPGFSGDGGPASMAQLNGPYGVTVDSSGNLFIADRHNYRIRKVTAAGVISTVAGSGAQGFSGDGGPATTAGLSYPEDVAVDSSGNLYIADTANNRIRKVTAAGVISTVAGNGTQGFSGDGGPATAAQLYWPCGVAVDSSGSLYVADSGNHRIRKVTAAGMINTIAGNGAQGFSGDGGPATAAELAYVRDVEVDSSGTLYIADTENHRIRMITAAGLIGTAAGNGALGFSGDGGAATMAQLNGPYRVAVNSDGDLYIADSGNHRIRKVTAAGLISTVAGNGTEGFSGDGGAATMAQLNWPRGVAIDSEGDLLIADTGNHRIRKVTSTGMISTVAGNGTEGFSGDGSPAMTAQLSGPYDVAVDSAGNFYIADTGNHRIRKVTSTGVISTVAGNGREGFSGDGGAATTAQVSGPYGVAVDSAGNLYIADRGNQRIRKVTSAGVISTVAGNGTQGFSGDGGAATTAQVSDPYGVAIDYAGNLYIADTGNQRIRKVMGVSSSDLFFPQVAVGGGYTTLFTVTNTGALAALENLILTDQQGNPLYVSGTLIDSFGNTWPSSLGSTFALMIPAGGTVFLSATGSTPTDPVKAGWGKLTSTGASLSAVATYEYVVGTAIQTMVGVLQSQPLQYATIPVDNSSSQGKQLAYAIANPTSQTISVKLALIGQDGTVVDDTVTVSLGPGEQIARYLWQDLAAHADFKGSVVLRGQAGATFIAVALVEKQGIFAAIPAISGKAPGVPN